MAQQELRSPGRTLLSPSFPSQWERPYRPQTQKVVAEVVGLVRLLVEAQPARPMPPPPVALQAAAARGLDLQSPEARRLCVTAAMPRIVEAPVRRANRPDPFRWCEVGSQLCQGTTREGAGAVEIMSLSLRSRYWEIFMFGIIKIYTF